MNRIPKVLRFQLFALALAGISIFIFVALISPYAQTRAAEAAATANSCGGRS